MEYIQPSQKISFYNVTGLIERDKNIFYSPRIEDLLEQHKNTVCESYKSLFDVVCPPPFTELTDLVISQWNPEDRQLKVNCSVDYFRKGSAGRNTLNYAIIEVDRGTEKFYYGYFITDARQGGANSSYVSLQLDEFTNVCYLSNTKSITIDFNPLKSFIANAFVERQHYDRVKVTESYRIVDGNVESPSSLEIGKHYTLIPYLINEADSEEYEETANVSIQFSVTRFGRTTYSNNLKVVKRDANWNEISSMVICGIRIDFVARKIVLYDTRLPFTTHVVEEIPFNDYYGTSTFITFSFYTYQNFHENAEGVDNLTFKSLVSEPENHNQLSDFANMDLFVKTEESYHYRQLFKDSRIPLTFNNFKTRFGENNILNKIPAEAYTKKTVAEARSYLQYLCSDGVNRYEEADAICQACIHYLHIVTTDQITYPTVIKGKNSDNEDLYFMAYYNKDYEVDKTFPSASQHIVIPFIAEIKGLESFARYLNGEWITGDEPVEHGINIHGYYKGHYAGSLGYYDSSDFSSFISQINDKYGYYIQSMFVTPYCDIPCSYDVETDCVIFNADVVNMTSQPKTPLRKRVRKGTWWGGYEYKHYTTISKYLEDYDSEVIEEPTVVLLPFEKVQVEPDTNNNNKMRFVETPSVMFEVGGTIDAPSSFTTTNEFTEKIMCFGLLVGKKGFENEFEGSVGRQILELKYGTSREELERYFYEPILEMEPYSFYSISMSEIESVLDRKRYYQMDTGQPLISDYDVFERKYHIPLLYNQAVNTMVKIGVIPEYTINNITQRYYSEALLFTTTSGVTVKVESYQAFMYVMAPKLQMQERLAYYNAVMEGRKSIVRGIGQIGSGVAGGNVGSAVGGVINAGVDVINTGLSNEQNIVNTLATIQSEKASAGQKADTFSQAGSDYVYELNLDEYCVMLNHYRIDELSYNSIAKALERYGYYVNRYDELNCFSRKGYNYIKLIAFDFDESDIKLTESQMNTINTILKQGVTLLHEKDYLHTNLHNYEVVLELVISSD